MTKRSVTCLYTELAKSYFLLGLFMAEENTCQCGVSKNEIAPPWCSNHEVHSP